MKVAIVQIGNSRGVRLPKSVLEQCRFTNSATLTVEDGRVVLSPIAAPRAGWAEAFRADSQNDLDEADQDWLEADLAGDEG